MPKPPLRTKAIVLRRTSYGETDRILNLLTPEGQKAVRARGVRKEKSKLAGGIELFSVSDVVIHEGRSEFGTLTSAKMLKFYQNILNSLPRLELASQILKEINRATNQLDGPEFFSLTEQALSGLDQKYPVALVQIWFFLNLKKATGEELNLLRDKSGTKLQEAQTYTWDSFAEAFVPATNGPFTASHIKLLRLMVSAPLRTVHQVKNLDQLLPDISSMI